jgi:hypothetical protein
MEFLPIHFVVSVSLEFNVSYAVGPENEPVNQLQ